MTDAGTHEPAADNARQIEQVAAGWLMSQADTATWAEQDQAALGDWLSQSIAHQVAFYRLEAALDRAGRLKALRSTVRPGPRMSRILTRAVAAISALAVLGVVGWQYVLTPRSTTYQTSVGNREILSLNDGSQIELNTDSTLRLAQEAGQRRAWLDKGEAYFQIKHDSRHPFVVTAGDARVVDLGTKFSLRRFPDRLEVTLVEGGARVETGNGARTVVLRPGDIAFARAGDISVSRKSGQQLTDELGWRRGVLTFRYATLAEAAAEFNRYNHTKIVIADPKIARLTIYGAFASNDVAAFTDATQAYFKLHVENRDGLIVLSH